MPKFEPMDPQMVVVGRGKISAEDRRPYVEALQASEAGRITLGRTDKPARVKRLMADASKETGIKIRSSWEDKREMVLYWKRVGL